MAEVCIICHNERAGERVADTSVIRTIRTVKERLHMATNNTLVVCPECLTAHAKKLKSYERKMLMHAVFAGFIILLIILVPLLAGSFNPGAILVGFIMGALLIALPLLDYVPPLANKAGMMIVTPASQVPGEAQAPATSKPADDLKQALSPFTSTGLGSVPGPSRHTSISASLSKKSPTKKPAPSKSAHKRRR